MQTLSVVAVTTQIDRIIWRHKHWSEGENEKDNGGF